MGRKVYRSNISATKFSGSRKRRKHLGEHSFYEDVSVRGPWNPPGPKPGELFGVMDRPFDFNEHHLEFDGGHYKRWVDGALEKEAFLQKGIVGVFPVSPLHTPSIIGKYIMAEFANPVFVSPRSTMSLYASLPVEIGVFARTKSHYEIIDIFSLEKQKYALYGTPNQGMICRWASVTPASSPPGESVPFPQEAVIKIVLKNHMNRWAKVEKAVFPGEIARIFYGDGLMSYPIVNIIIVNKGIIKAKVSDTPFRKGLLPSPISTLHATPIRLTEFSIFKPEATLLLGGY